VSCCFCRPPSDGPNSSLSAAAYVPVTGGHSGKLGTMLWQWCLDRPPGIYYVLSAVSPQLSHAADFLLAYLRRSDALISLRWLRVPECIRSKVAVMVYKVLHSRSASEMTYIVSGGALNSTHSLTSTAVHRRTLARSLAFPTFQVAKGFTVPAATASSSLRFTAPLLAAEYSIFSCWPSRCGTACHRR